MASGKPDASATFAIDLEDGASESAESAIEALDKLHRQINRDTAALGAMQKAMRNLQGGTLVNIEQFKKLKAQIDAKKSSIAQAQSAYLSLGGTFRSSPRSGKPAIDMLEKLGSTAQGLPGPIGGVIGRLGSLKGLLAGGAIVLGIAAIAAAIVALTVAAIAGTAALLKYGIAQAGARRGELLRLEGLTKMRNWWGVAAGNASEMQLAIDKVSSSTTLGRDKLEAYASQLYKMHLRGENLTQALEGTAIKAAALGDEGAKGFMGWAAGAAFAGQSVKRLADDVRARFGGIVAKQMLDLDVQAEKLRENFGVLFRDLKIEGLLKAISAVTSLFSQSTQSGRALKTLVQNVFQPMIGAIEYLGPVVKRFFQGMIIGALLIAVAVLTVRNWLRKTFGDSDVLKGMDAQMLALKLGAAAVGALAAVFVALAGAMLLAISPILGIGAALYGLYSLGAKLVDVFSTIDWGKLGISIVKGIVGGILPNSGWLVDAVSKLGEVAWRAFKSKLGISSPSKVFTRLGVAIPEGIESGVESGTPAARAAVAGIVDEPSAPGPGGARGGEQGRAQPGPSTITLNLGGITIQTSGDKPAEYVADVEAQLMSALERVAIQLGALVPRGA